MSVRFCHLLSLTGTLLLGSASLLADDALPLIGANEDANSVPSAETANLPLIVPALAASPRPPVEASEPDDASAKRVVKQKATSASESASRRAREEWQKQFTGAGARRRPVAEQQADKTPPVRRRPAAPTGSRPGSRPNVRQQPAQPRLPEIVPQAVRVPRYIEVFRSIPFSRALYDADPLYRHNATLELLLNQLRPAAPQIDTHVDVTLQPLIPYRDSRPLRSGYRPWSRYPWH